MATQKVICDTDVIIDYWNINNVRHLVTKNKLESKISFDNIILSSVSKMELIIGAANKSELTRINKNLAQFNIIFTDDNICQLAIELLQHYNLSHGLAISDSFIAATCLWIECPLFSYNIKDYKFIAGLQLYEPGR